MQPSTLSFTHADFSQLPLASLPSMQHQQPQLPCTLTRDSHADSLTNLPLSSRDSFLSLTRDTLLPLHNSYNHNFKGLYCACGCPYPDPQAEEQVEMIQCYICEDWFHENHLGLDSIDEILRDEEEEPVYDEYICQECSLTCSFLDIYPSSIWATLKQKNVLLLSDKEENGLKVGIQTCTDPGKHENGVPISEKSVNSSVTHCESETVSNEKDSTLKCMLGVDINTTVVLEKKIPMFLSKNWREMLCRCKTCCEFYSGKGIDYLIDKEDSLQEYEKIAKEKKCIHDDMNSKFKISNLAGRIGCKPEINDYRRDDPILVVDGKCKLQ